MEDPLNGKGRMLSLIEHLASEIILVAVLCIMIGFTLDLHASHDNDLASKSIDFIGTVIGILSYAMGVKSGKDNGSNGKSS